jgi:hypothetical protein
MSTADQILSLYNVAKGKNTSAIADDLGISRERVRQVLKANGLKSDFRGEIPARRRPGPVKPFEERAPFGQVLDLLELTNDQAAELVAAHPVTVAKYANGTSTAPEAMQLYLLACLGLGVETIEAAVEEGQRKLKSAVDTAKQNAKI